MFFLTFNTSGCMAVRDRPWDVNKEGSNVFIADSNVSCRSKYYSCI